MNDPARGRARKPGPPAGARAGRARGGPAEAAPTTSPDTPDADAPFRERRRGESRLRAPTPRVALVLFAAVLIAFLLYLGREALSPFVVGLLLVYLLTPPVEWLSRRGTPRWVAILVVYVGVVLVLIQALSLMLRPLVEQIRTFADDLPNLLGNLDRFYRALALPPQIREALDQWLAGLAEGGGIDPGVLLPVVNVTAGFVSSIFGYLIIPVWAFYLLKDRHQLTAATDRSLPPEWRDDSWAIARIVERVFSQWIRAQVFLGLTVGVATFTGLMVLNATVDPIFGRFALLLAVIAGVFELLPIIGPILAAIPAVLLALTAGLDAGLAALVLYLLVQQVENNLLVPKIQGDAVELHPSAVMFSLVVGGAIAGLLGAILALPVTAAGRNVFRYLFRRLTPPGEATAAGPPGSADTAIGAARASGAPGAARA
ncbi:MAG TPA: AI-2E family transporter [Candidatus Limnocylindrales bacterium]|jgi:predicted PurR-regulated permease PerM|nr:AI-2E family transporter [Candidatus Limnocylindrales bacterium]